MMMIMMMMIHLYVEYYLIKVFPSGLIYIFFFSSYNV